MPVEPGRRRAPPASPARGLRTVVRAVRPAAALAALATAIAAGPCVAAVGLTAPAPAPAPAPASAAEPPAPGAGPSPPATATAGGRPRVALALSGGGARGAAHLGVLRVLEALRVPVDCIAGTSMGAVVGGAFAAGNPTPALQDVIERTNWRDVFSDSPPRRELAARRKADDYKGLAAPEFGVRDGELLLPRGVVAGVTIEGVLRHLAAPAAGVDDFSRLPIPFRAVAADLETGAPVVLARGGLMQAMRASMAIPGVVAPVEIGGRLLVDGGIADNLPIDVARGTCDADVVVAVNIATPALGRDELGSALSVVGQLVNLLGKGAVDRQLARLGARDVLIEPDLGDLTAASFERQGEAIAAGERAARAAAPALARLALPEAEYAALRSTQRAAARAPAPIDAIEFEGLRRTRAAALAPLMDTRVGDLADETRLDADLRRLFGRGDFEAIGYRIDQTPAGRVLRIPVREKAAGPNYLRFGLGLASDFRDRASFTALVSHRRTWLNDRGAEWTVEAQIGATNALASEFYQPLDAAGRWFVAPHVRLSQTTKGLYAGDDRVAEYRLGERRAGVDLGVVAGTFGELRAGLLAKRVRASPSTAVPGFVSVVDTVAGARLQFYGDSLDAPWFPRSGQRTLVDAFASTATPDDIGRYRRVEAQWTGATSFGRHTLALTLAGGRGFGAALPPYELFTLGGPFRLSGQRIGRFAGECFALASLRYYRQQRTLPTLLGSGTYVGGSLEAGRIAQLFSGEDDPGTLWSTSLFVAAETFLGPAFLGVGWSPGGRLSAYVLIGAP